MAVERKYERDIDVLLAEEFAVSPRFANWFLSLTTFSEATASVVDVYVSRSDSTGESDLVVVFEDPEGNRRFALLIEDKIDAPVQPEQAERYRLRAEVEVSRGDYQEFEVVLCAPEAYPRAQPKAASFGRFIPYELISEFLRSTGADARSLYRANFIATAASRSANTWTKLDDQATNAFWDAAYEVATREFPALEMKPLNVTMGSTWINFRPRDMPTRPRRIYVSFKGDRGYMDLTFTNSLAHLFSGSVASLLDADMTVHQTGKSAAIRLRVERFKISDPKDDAIRKVRTAFGACERLINFYRGHRQELDAAASASVPVL